MALVRPKDMIKKATQHLRHLPAAPASWFLYGSDFEIRSLASANQHLSTIVASWFLGFSGYFWASPTNHLWIPANFKCHLDTTQKQSLRKSHDRPALVSWATLVWNSRRISRMSKSCSYNPSKFSQLKHTLSNNHVPNLHVSSLRVETHLSWALFGIPFQGCHAICPIASPFIFES